MTRTLGTFGLTALIAATFAAVAPAQEPRYKLTRGFPADEATIGKARDATTLRRAKSPAASTSATSWTRSKRARATSRPGCRSSGWIPHADQ